MFPQQSRAIGGRGLRSQDTWTSEGKNRRKESRSLPVMKPLHVILPKYIKASCGLALDHHAPRTPYSRVGVNTPARAACGRGRTALDDQPDGAERTVAIAGDFICHYLHEEEIADLGVSFAKFRERGQQPNVPLSTESTSSPCGTRRTI